MAGRNINNLRHADDTTFMADSEEKLISLFSSVQFNTVQLLSHVRLFVTPWTTAHQASLSITSSQNLPKPMSIESLMPSNYLILCRPLLLPSIFPSIKVFSNESALHIRCPKYWSFSFNISPSNEHPGLTSFRMDWLDLLAVQGTLKSLLQHHGSKASILLCSAFCIVQLSHPCMTTGKKISLLVKMKEENEKAGLKLNIQKMKIMASSPITSWQIDGGNVEMVSDFIFLVSKISADSDCCHEIERCLLVGRIAITNLDSVLKSRDITLLTKVHIVKAMVFPIVMYGCESWTTKKAESWRIDAFELQCWRRLLRVLWAARRSIQS